MEGSRRGHTRDPTRARGPRRAADHLWRARHPPERRRSPAGPHRDERLRRRHQPGPLGADRFRGHCPIQAGRPALDVDDITILTGWAEGIAEALAYAPDKTLPLLAEARAGEPWRPALGIVEPSPSLQRALDAVTVDVTGAVGPEQTPTCEDVLLATQQSRLDERAVEKLARRVLRSTLDQLRSRQPTTA